jgi:hypothetical protein
MSTASARQVSAPGFAPVRRPAAAVKAFPDQAAAEAMHPGVYKLALGCWVGLLAISG